MYNIYISIILRYSNNNDIKIYVYRVVFIYFDEVKKRKKYFYTCSMVLLLSKLSLRLMETVSVLLCVKEDLFYKVSYYIKWYKSRFSQICVREQNPDPARNLVAIRIKLESKILYLKYLWIRIRVQLRF